MRSPQCTQGVESCHTMESNQGTKIKLHKNQFFIKKILKNSKNSKMYTIMLPNHKYAMETFLKELYHLHTF